MTNPVTRNLMMGAGGGTASTPPNYAAAWTQELPTSFDANGRTFNGIAPLNTANTTYGIVGDNGVVYTSSDSGVTWTSRTSGSTNAGYSIASDGTTNVVLVGGSGTIATSTLSNLATWTQVSSQVVFLYGVVWTGSQFVAVGATQTIITSPTGATWTARTANVTGILRGIARLGSTLIAVGTGGVITTSTDGVTWTARTSGTTSTLFGIGTSGSLAVAVGASGVIRTSTDGITWTTRTSGTTNQINCVANTPIGWIAGTSNGILYSSDAITWSTVLYPMPVSMSYVSSDSTQTLIVGAWASLFKLNATASSWTLINQRYNNTQAGAGRGIYSTNFGGYYVPGWAGSLFTSGDGSTWSPVSISSAGVAINALTENNSIMVAVGQTGTILTSTDGATWTSRTSSTTTILTSVSWNGSLFLTQSSTGVGRTSSDGITWASVTSTAAGVNGNAWHAGLWISVGNTGAIYTSPDAATWTTRTSGTTQNLTNVVSNGSILVACGASGTILTSTDGITWTARTSGTAVALSGLTWDGSNFVAGGTGGVITTSPDGITWTVRLSAVTGMTTTSFTIAAAPNSRAVIVSNPTNIFTNPA